VVLVSVTRKFVSEVACLADSFTRRGFRNSRAFRVLNRVIRLDLAGIHPFAQWPDVNFADGQFVERGGDFAHRTELSAQSQRALIRSGRGGRVHVADGHVISG
jgi:hypothetical protein